MPIGTQIDTERRGMPRVGVCPEVRAASSHDIYYIGCDDLELWRMADFLPWWLECSQ